ncbi:helix-turn-helix transcriptional regulator [Aneurinibacillus soli]|nr:helix-turn-helix transcriptional regulator [Aneurinibacillus soli]
MMSDISYTTEEIASLLKVSKLTVYDLIKKGDLIAYRVGRQMRVDAADLEAYKQRARGGVSPIRLDQPPSQSSVSTADRDIVISGQDMALDILTRHLEGHDGIRPLRSYIGSLNGLMAMYRGEAHIVSTHLWDGDTGEYNIPYVRKILVSHHYTIVNLVSRQAGLYVQKGNPKKLTGWSDLGRDDISIVNREKGSGARVLLDEQLRLHRIASSDVHGYQNEESSHLGVAGAVASGCADTGVGIEKVAYVVGVDFIPLIQERYDLVILKTPDNTMLLDNLLRTLQSSAFQSEIKAIGGYDLTHTGKILYENR